MFKVYIDEFVCSCGEFDSEVTHVADIPSTNIPSVGDELFLRGKLDKYCKSYLVRKVNRQYIKDPKTNEYIEHIGVTVIEIP